MLVALLSLSTTIRPSLFDYDATPGGNQTVSILKLRWRDWTGTPSHIKNKIKESLSSWRNGSRGWMRVASADGDIDLEDQGPGGEERHEG